MSDKPSHLSPSANQARIFIRPWSCTAPLGAARNLPPHIRDGRLRYRLGQVFRADVDGSQPECATVATFGMQARYPHSGEKAFHPARVAVLPPVERTVSVERPPEKGERDVRLPARELPR